MSDATHIEWTDATWNPITGCTRVSEGCRNCYAEIMAARFSGPGQWGEGLARIVRDQNGKAIDHRWTGKLRFNNRALDLPLRWRKPRRIFVNSTSDLFHEEVPDEWIDKVFAVMARAPQHTFQVLTKRPERMQAYLSAFKPYLHPTSRVLIGDHSFTKTEAAGPPRPDYVTRGGVRPEDRPKGSPLFFPKRWPLPNVWLGTSVEDQAAADERIPHLLATPAAVRFVSAEPLLGPVDMDAILAPDMGIYALTGIRSDGSGPSGFSQGPRLDWVIVGGESGPGARPMHPDWARSLRDQCQAAGVAYFFKQWGEWLPFGQSGFTAWHAHTRVSGDLRKPKGKWWGHAHFNDGAGGRNTHAYGPVETLNIDLRGTQAVRIGKSRSGRLLDGREWNQMPGVL